MEKALMENLEDMNQSPWDAIMTASRNLAESQGCSVDEAIGLVLASPAGSVMYTRYLISQMEAARDQERERVAENRG